MGGLERAPRPPGARGGPAKLGHPSMLREIGRATLRGALLKDGLAADCGARARRLVAPALGVPRRPQRSRPPRKRGVLFDPLGAPRALAIMFGLTAVVLAAWMAPVADGAESVWEAVRLRGASWSCGIVMLPAASIHPTHGSTTARPSATWTSEGAPRRCGSARRSGGRASPSVRSSPARAAAAWTRRGWPLDRSKSWEPLQGALRDEGRRQRQIAEIRRAIAEHRDGPPLVLVTHGTVIDDLTGLRIPMGAFVVLRRTADGHHSVAGQLYVD